jgi:predicted permease
MRHLFRRLLHSPTFTAITLLTLAIGIGATTAVFSVVESVLLKPLPYPEPDRLISIVHAAAGLKITELPVSPSAYFTYREEGRAFEDIGLETGSTHAITGLAEAEQVDGMIVTDGTLPLLGVRPVLGRLFTRDDDRAGAPKTMLLSYGYWQRKFAGDRNVVGRTLRVDSELREIIGVLPKDFHLDSRNPAILEPFQFDRSNLKLGNFSYQAIGRLKPGFTIEQASADVARMIPLMFEKFAPPTGASLKLFREARIVPNLRPLKRDVVGDVGRFLWVLMAVIGIVLLIACANVANLLLVRAEGRQQELAVRAALGAGRRRIAGELLLESLALGVVGGALGAGVAYAAVRMLVAAAPVGLPRINEIGLDAGVLLFALAVSALCGVLFGLIPVVKYAGPQIASTIRHGGRSLSQSRERHRTRSTLVVVQVALALVLLVASGLMIRTVQAMRRIQPGFTRPAEIQTLSISIPQAQVKDDVQTVRVMDAIRRKIETLPGVEAVAFGAGVPLTGQNSFDPIFVEDQPLNEGKLPPVRRNKFVSPGFARTLGNPLIAGRDFTWADIYNGTPVTMLTENLSREYWGSPSAAIGKRIRENQSGVWREVVGVVGNERDNGVDQPAAKSVYWPVLVHDFWGNRITLRRTVRFVIRSPRTGSEGFLNEVRQAIWSVNPDLPLSGVRTMQDLYERSMARTSFSLVMLTIAGGMALLLGIIGIYGVISYSVSQRTREIGIRMALGAQQPALTRMFIAHGLRLAAIGLAFGLVAAFALTRGMKSLLFGVGALDPITFVAVALGLGAAAALASYVPSRRATAVDPVEALRAE